MTELADEGGGRDGIERATALAATALLAVVFVIFAAFTCRMVAYLYPCENGEGTVMVDAQFWHALKVAHRDPDDYPYILPNYPPVYAMLWALGMAVTGRWSFLAGRLISLLALMGIGWGVYRTVRRETGYWLWGLVGALGFYGIGNTTLSVGAVARVDVLAAGLSFAGICLTYSQTGTRRWVLPIGMFVLAVYTKQSSIWGFLASQAYLWCSDRPKALKSAGAFGGVSLAVLILLQAMSGGAFWRNIIGYTWSGFDRAVLCVYLREWLQSGHVLFLASLVGLVATSLSRRRTRVLLFAYAGFNLLGLLLLGKIGASCLYVVELSIALSMTFPIMAADVVALTRGSRWRSRLAAGGIVLAVALHVVQVWPACRAAHGWPSPELTRLNRTMCQIFGQVPGTVLTEELGWSLVARRDPLVNPSHLAEAGAPARVKYVGTRRELVTSRPVPAFAKAHDRVWADILAQRFAVIQTNAVLDPRDRGNAPLDAWLQARSVTDQRFSPAWQQAIAEQYELRQRVGLVAIYTPRRPSVAHPDPPDADSSK